MAGATTIAVSVVTKVFEEGPFVGRAMPNDAGSPQSKQMCMAAFVGVVARQDFGMPLFQKHGPERFMSQNLNNMDASLGQHKKVSFPS